LQKGWKKHSAHGGSKQIGRLPAACPSLCQDQALPLTGCRPASCLARSFQA
jgi:hypothetical protein